MNSIDINELPLTTFSQIWGAVCECDHIHLQANIDATFNGFLTEDDQGICLATIYRHKFIDCIDDQFSLVKVHNIGSGATINLILDNKGLAEISGQ